MTQKTQEKPIYSFSVSAGTTNLDEPIEGIDYEVIAYDLDSVIEWCKTEYDMSKLEEITSDELSSYFDYIYYGQISDHGNINEISDVNDYLDNDGQIKEEYETEIGEFRDVLEINGSEISPEDYKYLKSGNYHRSVIDLTSEDN